MSFPEIDQCHPMNKVLNFCIQVAAGKNSHQDQFQTIQKDDGHHGAIMPHKLCKDSEITLVRHCILTPMGKPSFQRTVWFWMQNLAFLSEEKIDEIETQGAKFYQLSAGIKIFMILISYQGLIYRKLEGVQLFSERIII